MDAVDDFIENGELPYDKMDNGILHEMFSHLAHLRDVWNMSIGLLRRKTTIMLCFLLVFLEINGLEIGDVFWLLVRLYISTQIVLK